MTLSDAEIERIKAWLGDARRTPRKNADGSTTHFVCIDKSRLESWKAAAHAPGGMSATIGVSGAALWLLVDAYETADEIAIDGEALLAHIAALQLQLDAAKQAGVDTGAQMFAAGERAGLDRAGALAKRMADRGNYVPAEVAAAIRALAAPGDEI